MVYGSTPAVRDALTGEKGAIQLEDVSTGHFKTGRVPFGRPSNYPRRVPPKERSNMVDSLGVQ